MKNLINSYILSFVICFMLFIYEPITMYSTNMNDLWFEFSMIIMPLIKLFLKSFIFLSLCFSIVYFIFYKLLKLRKVYQILLIIFFIIFLVSYIQGNYLAGNLPGLDGAIINWNKYNNENITSIILLVVTCLIMIISSIKFGLNKIVNFTKYITLVIFAMLTVSLITTFLTTKILDCHKSTYVLTTNNINNASNDKNFFIFLLDAVDSRKFNEIVSDSKYKNMFEDFTYYPDTMSAYPFTRDSIPFILSGVINENKDDFLTYETKAYDKSPLFPKLSKLGYDINLYDGDLSWNSDGIKTVSNKVDTNGKVNEKKFYNEELKYILFKYLPFYLKKYSNIEKMNFKKCRVAADIELFDWDNYTEYKRIKNNKLKIKSNKYFSFTHIEGGHRPFTINDKFEIIDGTYDQKLLANAKIIEAFINRLKENDVYDNSVIIIMSDHGFNYEDIEEVDGRQNPILYIKGIDEHHDMQVSDKPISYFDLMDAYSDLLDGKKSDEIFADIEYPRTRRYIWYQWTKEDYMVEYEQTGKAWDMDTLVKTGKEFNR